MSGALLGTSLSSLARLCWATRALPRRPTPRRACHLRAWHSWSLASPLQLPHKAPVCTGKRVGKPLLTNDPIP